MNKPPGVFKCEKMTEQKKNQKKNKTKNKNSPVLDLQRHLQMLVMFIHASRNSDIGPMKNILNLKQMNYLDGICK